MDTTTLGINSLDVTTNASQLLRFRYGYSKVSKTTKSTLVHIKTA